MESRWACRVCLTLDARLHGLNQVLLSQYEAITGLQVEWGDGRPLCFCWECAARVAAHATFRDKCLSSHTILGNMLRQHGEITQETIKTINRSDHNLISSLSYCREDGAPLYNICYIKEETVDHKEEDQCQDTVKEEGAGEDVSDGDSSVADVKFDDVAEVSDDDVPLVDIKKEGVATKNSAARKVGLKRKLRDQTRERERNVVKKRILKPRRVKEIKENVESVVKKRGPFQEDFATEILLTKDQQLEELQVRASSLNYLNSPYKCTKCYKGFVDHSAYMNHVTKHDESSGEHECDVCRMRYPSVRRLRAHAVSSHARKYACTRCDHVTHTANQAREHDKWHKGHLYECGLCGETFRKPTSHLTHMRKRHPTEFVCGVCGDSFVGRHGLMMHKKKTHRIAHVDGKGNEAPEALERYCRECDVQFTSVEAWRRHMVTSSKHALNNEFGNGCRACGERFDTRERLAAHCKQRHARASRADAAAPSFTVTHLQCGECPAKFTNRSKMLAHVRRVHLGLKYNKNIVCEQCGKSCTSNATLKYHQRTHTGERPFACAECPKRFSDRNQLRIHTRTHTDERPYSCAVCGKTFRQKPALNRHARVHTGAKPYECTYCGKTFSQSNSLKIHVHTVHLKLPPLYRGRGKPPPAQQPPPQPPPQQPPPLGP